MFSQDRGHCHPEKSIYGFKSSKCSVYFFDGHSKSALKNAFDKNAISQFFKMLYSSRKLTALDIIRKNE